MVDYFSLAITHVLLVLALWKLLQRDDLDHDPEVVEAEAAPAPAIGPVRRGVTWKAPTPGA